MPLALGKHQHGGVWQGCASTGAHTGGLLCQPQPGPAGVSTAGSGEDVRKSCASSSGDSSIAASPGRDGVVLLPASSCLCALHLEGTELCWDLQLCCLQCPTCPSTGKCSLGLHRHPRNGSHAQGSHGSVRAPTLRSSCIFGTLLSHLLLEPFPGTPPFCEADLPPITSLPAAQQEPGSPCVLPVSLETSSLWQCGAWQGQSQAAAAASGSLCGGAHCAAHGIQIPTEIKRCQRLSRWLPTMPRLGRAGSNECPALL